jgi:phage tail sheath gpL-like
MVGGISFNNFPDNWNLPLHWVEVDSSQAGLPVNKASVLVVGQKLTAGTAPANVPIAVGSLAEVKAYAGEGSMLERMVAKFLKNNAVQTLFIAPLAEPSGGTAATGSITITSAPTAPGIVDYYIAGQNVEVSALSTDTAASFATKVAAAINAKTTLPVTAVAVSTAVNLTCRWKGTTGNEILLQDSLLGLAGGEAIPTGLAFTYAAMSGGVGAPDMTTLIANLGDDDYKYVVMPFTDTTSLDLWATEYGFGDTGRWGWMRQLYGAVYSAIRGTYSALMTSGPTRNYPTITMKEIEPLTPAPTWEVAAAYAAKASRALTNDPARPLQTLEFDDIMVAPRGSRFSKTQINSLTSVGYATQTVSPNGKMMILRESTCYQKNVYGSLDDAYELVTTLYTLSSLFERQRQAITNKFPRHKLADDGTRFGPGQAIVTPKIIKAELVAEYAQDEYAGLVENAKQFKNNLLVQRDPDNPNRVSVLYPPDLINQLRIFSVLASFRLQYDRGVAA